MTVVVVRKGVLLRLDPELLDRIDAIRGAQNRTEFLVRLIEREVGILERPRSANFGSIEALREQDLVSSTSRSEQGPVGAPDTSAENGESNKGSGAEAGGEGDSIGEPRDASSSADSPPEPYDPAAW